MVALPYSVDKYKSFWIKIMSKAAKNGSICDIEYRLRLQLRTISALINFLRLAIISRYISHNFAVLDVANFSIYDLEYLGLFLTHC